MSAFKGAAPRLWRELAPFSPAVGDGNKLVLTITAHSIERVLSTCSSDAFVFGPANGPLRRARIASDHRRACYVVERRGAGFEPEMLGERKLRRALIHQQLLRTRERQFRTIDAGLRHAERLIDAAVADLGEAWAASLFLRVELDHWEQLCPAGVVLGQRQVRNGIGWCNVACLRYCASRRWFHDTLRLFEKLGYELRQVHRAEESGGWGGALLCHAWCTPVFLDVDMSEGEERALHAPLGETLWHGGPGYWCAMHGESVLDGGVRQLVARYDLGALGALIEQDGLDLALRGGVVEDLGRPTPVKHTRIAQLERDGHLAPACAERLRLGGVRISRFLAIDSGAEIPTRRANDLQPFDCASAPRPSRGPRRRMRLQSAATRRRLV